MEAFFPIQSFHSTPRFIREVTRSLTADHMIARGMNIACNRWQDLDILSNYSWRWDILTKDFLTACWEQIMVKTYNSRVRFQVLQEEFLALDGHLCMTQSQRNCVSCMSQCSSAVCAQVWNPSTKHSADTRHY